MTESRRELYVSTAFALWGLAVAMALLTLWRKPAPPEQTMGLAKVLAFEANGPLRWIAGLMLLPAAFPALLRPVARRLAAGRPWAGHAVMASALLSLWSVTVYPSLLRAVVPCAVTALACTLLRKKHLDWTRHDIVLIPVVLTTLLALIDLLPAVGAHDHLLLAAALVFALRVAVAFLHSPLPPALAFLVAPLALILQTGFFARDQRYFGWHALAIVVVTPLFLRVVLHNRRAALRALAFFVFPIALYAYWNAMSLSTAEGKTRMNFFEDGHSLLPASEYLRGERPYRDILPGHGLIEDGGFDALVFFTGEVNAGRRGKAREVFGTLTAVALYFLAFAVTGSPRAALLATLFTILLGLFTPVIRLLVPMATLAVLVAAVRWRRSRWFALAGFGTVLCGATSLDFGAYTFLTLIVALLRLRTPMRGPALRAALVGILSGVVPLMGALALFGILDDFFHSTFVEVLRLSPAYTLGFHALPEAMSARRFFPEVLSELLDPRGVLYLAWPAIAVFAGVCLNRRWPRRFEPAVLVSVFAVLTGISYAERHHLYFAMPAVVLLVLLIVTLLRSNRALALVAIAAALVIANPTTHVSVLGMNRTTRGPAPNWLTIDDIGRARGALWHASDAAAVASVKRYLSLSLAPDETFFDFTNSGALYFLFRRDHPIREYEVAFYQTERQQREVIQRIEENPKIRAALLPRTPDARFAVDIPNAWRAPLVHQYLVDHFELDFEEGELQFWKRK